MLDKISKLIGQAEGASTDAERDVFMEKAQTLAMQYSIDLATARMHKADKERVPTPMMKTVQIGRNRQVGLAHMCELISAVAGVNDVKMTIRMDNTAVHLYGFDEDIQIVESLYGMLAHQMQRDAMLYIKSGEYKKEMVWSESKWEMVPMHGRTARTNFYAGFVSAVAKRLRLNHMKAENAAVKADKRVDAKTGLTGTEMVLVAKKDAVKEFYSKKTGHIRRSWGGASVKNYGSSAYNGGQDSGQRASMSSAKQISNRTTISS